MLLLFTANYKSIISNKNTIENCVSCINIILWRQTITRKIFSRSYTYHLQENFSRKTMSHENYRAKLIFNQPLLQTKIV